jgi:chorismate synthase
MFSVISFGESHGLCVGAILTGCPAGLPISTEYIQKELDLRRPGQSSITTTRSEKDQVNILSGVFNGYSTGAPICFLIWNKDVDSEPYRIIKNTPRPGHADYVARKKYGGYNDWKGGGFLSSRLTASYVMAGSIAKKLLEIALDIDIIAYTVQIGEIKTGEISIDEARKYRYENEVRCPDKEVASAMKQFILQVKNEGDSVGGIVKCIVNNLPVGIGEPLFSSLDAELSRALFCIPAVKGVEFGVGFDVAGMKGSINNDSYKIIDGKIVTNTNNSGGILGGISNGMPIVMKIAFKPTPSISREQNTVDLENMKEVKIKIPGRHDPCVVPRAVPIVENIVAIVLADMAIRAGLIPSIIK